MRIYIREVLLVVFIFALAAVLRFYQLPARYIFTADEEYQSTYAKTIVEDFHPVWIGVSAGDTGFYLGPYFTYFTAFWLYLSNGDPLLTGYVSSLLGAFTAVLIFYIGKNISNVRVGLMAALFYAFSPFMVYFDQRYWNPSPIPFLVCLLILSFQQMKRQKWWILTLLFALGAIWHVHLSLAPLYLVGFWGIWHYRKSITLAPWLVSILLFLFTLLPLAIFDLNHDFSNILTPFRLVETGGRTFKIFANFNLYVDTLARFIYLNPGLTNDGELRYTCLGEHTVPTIQIVLIALIPIVAIFVQKSSWKNYQLRPVLVSFIILTLAFIFYPGPIAPYYALGLLPLYFLMTSHVLSKAFVPIILIFAFFSINTLLFTDVSYGLSHKQKLIGNVMEVVQSDSYTLVEEGGCHKYAGWRYLFFVYGKKPSSSSTDSALGWLYPHEIESGGKYIVTVSASHELPAIADPVSIIRQGGYTAVITYGK